MGSFPEVDPVLDLPALDKAVLELWQERDVFARSVSERAGALAFVFYEGPPTANGLPGVHHVEARVFKDVFPRFQTMRGRKVERKGGWDCHGLPVEVAVERELGLTGKREVEAYGVEAFNARCRASVERYVGEFTDLTRRIGFWIDTSKAYRTMDASYVQSVWWALATLHRRGLLYEDYKVLPYCPRCGTPLSDAELAQGYRRVSDPSVYLVFPVTTGHLAEEGAGLLVWTTTPWTLLSNAAVAASPEVDYVLAEATGPAGELRRMVLAAARVEEVLGERATVLRPVPFEELLGARYERPYDLVPLPEGVDAGAGDRAWRVVGADYVTTTDGSGLVHTAPAFGADDMATGRREGLPVLRPVDGEGRFDASAGPFAGLGVKAADPAIVEDLAARGLLWRTETYVHDYPHCWRCDTPLLYYALSSWFARTTAVAARMLEENAEVAWQPTHIRDGRFGDWLSHNVDWAISRTRYWGTPLPLWRCAAGHVTPVESLADLSARAGKDLTGLDPHRPFVDEVTFACPECGAEARRVPDVLDAWFDSGSMPFAQWGYPLDGQEAFDVAFPADFISEAIDQTRGWFYSLLAVNTLLFDRAPYRNVVCLGHIVDRDGRKMSKSLGNVLDPFELLDRFGADPLRWWMLASGSPWVSRRLSPEALEEVTRSFFLTLWNTYAFFCLYARLEDFDPTAASERSGEAGGETALDRWALAELARTVEEVTSALEAYDATTAARRIAELTDDLSNWYVRLSRRRFWRGTGGEAAAFSTLWTCLEALTRLVAPYAPFVAETMWQGLVTSVDPSAADSVHLAAWPTAAPRPGDESLRSAMAEVRRLVSLGRQARTEAKVRVRQPLARALVTVDPETRDAVVPLLDLVAGELNVKSVSLAEGDTGLVKVALAPVFRTLGRRFGPATQTVAAAIRSVDAEAVASGLRGGGTVTLEVEGVGAVELGSEEITLVEEPVTGWRVVRDGPTSVGLDLEITPELRREGMARELVRAVADLRKSSGLAVSDRIELAVAGGHEVAEALAEHREHVLAETLAVALLPAAEEGGSESDLAIEGLPVHLWLRRVTPA